MNNKTKESIDNMSYDSMLYLWRNEPIGHPYFQGETGDYFTSIMKAKRANITDSEHTKTSKNIGWER